MASKASGQVTVVDVTDAYSVLLTSEAYTFIGNTAGAPSGLSCTTQAVAYCGAQQCSSVSISTVTCPTGISATISDNNTVSPTITFTTTATITETCEATIPVVIDGVTIDKKFSFAVAKQGTQGDTGATGKGISSVTPQYYISTSKTSATGGSWSDTAPTTIEKGTYLWTRMKVVYTNPASTEYTTATYDSMTDSRIEQLKDSITLSVTDGSVGNTAKIKLGIDDETKEASIDLTGAVSFTDLSTAGNTTINGANITTGTISADRIDASTLFAKDITATGKIQFNNGFYSLLIDETSKKISLDSWGDLYIEGSPVRICSPVGYIILSAANGISLQSPTHGVAVTGPLSVTGDLTIGDKKLESGSWTPTIYGATVSSYTTQQGWYLKFGNVVIVGWYMYVDFASGQTSKSYVIQGLPYNPVVVGTGGGVCSGFFADEQIDFAGWYANTDGKIYGQGTDNGYAGDRWTIGNIFCGTTGSFSSGTIIYTTSTT